MTTSPAAGAATVDAEIGARIRSAILINNFNVKALSDVTGISYPTLRRSLAGGRSLTIRELGDIADALQVSTKTLLPPILTEDAAA